jgi:cytochrome P450
LHAIVKKTFHLHLPLPILLLHVNSKDTQILNYKIIANTNVIVNIWAIGHDPYAWKKPLEFNLDQFSSSNINVEGLNYNLWPFGSGHQQCPCLDLGQIMVQLGLAKVLHAFD